jgi:dihydroorotate dehydrogenase (NAD+) catalytic subunit
VDCRSARSDDGEVSKLHQTVAFHPRAGNPTPRTAETASGLLHAIGLDNHGITHFIEHHLPYLRTVGTAVIANIAGESKTSL